MLSKCCEIFILAIISSSFQATALKYPSTIGIRNSSAWTPPTSSEYEGVINDCRVSLNVSDRLFNLSNYGVILDELVETEFTKCVDEETGVLINNVYYLDRLIKREENVEFRPRISNTTFDNCLKGALNTSSDNSFIKYFWACTITPLYYQPNDSLDLSECYGTPNDTCIHINGYMRLDYMNNVLCSFRKMGYYFQSPNTDTWTFSNFRVVQNTGRYSEDSDVEIYKNYSKCFEEGVPVDNKTLLGFEKCQTEQSENYRSLALYGWNATSSTTFKEYEKECNNTYDYGSESYFNCLSNKTNMFDETGCFYVERSIIQLESVFNMTDIRDDMRLCFETSFLSGTIHLNVFYQCAMALF